MATIQNVKPGLEALLAKAQALPAAVDTSDATATAEHILKDETAYVGSEKITGTMANNGSISKTLNPLTQTSVSVPKGYTDGGTVTVASAYTQEVDAQDDLLDQALAALEGKKGGAGATIETCTVNIGEAASTDNVAEFYEVAYMGVDASGNLTYKHEQISNNGITITALCNSIIAIHSNTSLDGVNGGTLKNLELLFSTGTTSSGLTHVLNITTEANQAASVYNTSSHIGGT